MTFMRETNPSTLFVTYSSLPISFSWTMSRCLHFFGLQSNPQFHNCISLAHSPPLCMLLFLVAIAHNLSIVDQIFDLIPCTPLLLVFPFHDPLCLGHRFFFVPITKTYLLLINTTIGSWLDHPLLDLLSTLQLLYGSMSWESYCKHPPY